MDSPSLQEDNDVVRLDLILIMGSSGKHMAAMKAMKFWSRIIKQSYWMSFEIPINVLAIKGVWQQSRK